MNTTHAPARTLFLVVSTLTAAFAVCFASCKDHKSGANATPPAHAAGDKVTAAEAIARLTEGNARFVAGRSEHPRQAPGRRTELAVNQHPFAVILGCADSRTGPEMLFDQGLGDLFVVREAGNVVDDHTIGSIEYGVEHLHAPLVVVLGHERCGAVAAARDAAAGKGHGEGHIESLLDAIRPAVEATTGQDADATCRANIRNMVRALQDSDPLLKPLVEKSELTVVGAFYDLDTGKVEFLPAR
jgi:carbonic anhydrase